MPSPADETAVSDAPAVDTGRSPVLAVAPGLLAVLVALATWAMSFDLHPDDSGYPRVLATLLLGFGAWNIIADLRGRHDASEVESDYGTLSSGRVISFALLVAVSIWLVTPVGFYPSAAIVIVGGMVIMGVRRPLLLIGYPVAVLALGYVLFSLLLRVPLPLARGF
jgi:putative tricarboxylic transport membrane protein